jgi:hypothetical protein
MIHRSSARSPLAAACRRQVWLWATVSAVAQADPGPAAFRGEENGDGAERKLPAVSLLPTGSVLRKVMIPRYDRNRKLTAVLRTGVMTIVDPQTVEGAEVSLELYHPDRTPRARMNLVKATFDQRKGTLNAREPVEVVSADFSAHGAGLIYIHEQAKGFLLGPVNTRFYAPPPTTSMTRPSLQRAAATTVAASLIASASAEPQRLTQEQRAAMAAEAAPVAGQADRAQAEAKDSAAATQAVSAAADGEVAEFVEQTGLKGVTAPVPPPAEAKPLEVKPGPGDTVIQAKDGMYFDSEKGLLVFLKDVQLTDPRFSLSGANELKIFLEKKPVPPKPADGGKPTNEKNRPDPMGGSGGFGDVDRIVATGTLRITRKSSDQKPDLEASAAALTYHAKTGELVIHGGYPWFKQGDTVMRAREPDLYLRVKDGNLITEGQWDTVIQLAKPDKPKQP